METIQTSIGQLLKALTVASFALIASFQTSAAVIYNSFAEFELVSINVTSAGGDGSGSGGGSGTGTGGGSGTGNANGNAPNYEISLLTRNSFDSFVATTGDGDANFLTNFEPPVISDWTVGDEFYQSSESFGEAGASVLATGTADSYTTTDFSLLFVNNSSGNRSITFELLFTSFVSTYLEFTGLFDPKDDGGSYAEIYLVDEDVPNEYLFISSAELFAGEPLFNDVFLEESVSFTLAAGKSKTIYGSTYSEGYATAVPEPSLLWAMSAGFIGLFGFRVARRTDNGLTN